MSRPLILVGVLVVGAGISDSFSVEAQTRDVSVHCECPQHPERSGDYPPGTICVRICVDPPRPIPSPVPAPQPTAPTFDDRKADLLKKLDREVNDSVPTQDFARVKANLLQWLYGEVRTVFLSTREDDATTRAFMREATDACQRVGTPTTQCALEYTALHKNDVPSDYMSRRNAEHYFLTRRACEAPAAMFGRGTSPRRLVFDAATGTSMIAAVALYSVLKDVDYYWGVLFPETAGYLGASEWVTAVDEYWSMKSGVPLGTFRGYITGTTFTTSRGTLKEGYWAIRGIVDCHRAARVAPTREQSEQVARRSAHAAHNTRSLPISTRRRWLGRWTRDRRA